MRLSVLFKFTYTNSETQSCVVVFYPHTEQHIYSMKDRALHRAVSLHLLSSRTLDQTKAVWIRSIHESFYYAHNRDLHAWAYTVLPYLYKLHLNALHAYLFIYLNRKMGNILKCIGKSLFSSAVLDQFLLMKCR